MATHGSVSHWLASPIGWTSWWAYSRTVGPPADHRRLAARLDDPDVRQPGVAQQVGDGGRGGVHMGVIEAVERDARDRHQAFEVGADAGEGRGHGGAEVNVGHAAMVGTPAGRR